jgi:uncharacterized protein with von Willebrand factor type A (vWA) domain
MSFKTEFKTELAKSAFNDLIYDSLPIDYYLPFITSTHKVLLAYDNIHAKFYQAHDAFLMHYKPYSTVYQSLKKSSDAPVWRRIVEKTLKSDLFLDVNKITAGSSELSVIAAVKFLDSLLKLADVERIQRDLEKSKKKCCSQQSLDQLVEEVFNSTDIERAINDVLTAVREFKESRESAEEAVLAMAGGQGGGFMKEALSVVRFLEKPEEFRKRVALLKYAKIFFAKFLATVPTSMIHEQTVSVYGGVSGVTRMFSEKQIPDILPSELALAQLGEAGRALLAVKIAQKQLMVYQHSASVKPVIFVDKSGSMAEPYSSSNLDRSPPKISVACGLALALHRKLNADIYLFDTELDKVSPEKVIDILLKIDADGGTDIDPVLSEIIKHGKTGNIYIIISDGITAASPHIIDEFKASGLAKMTKLILIPPSKADNWVQLLLGYGNVISARDVVEFEHAVKRVLST